MLSYIECETLLATARNPLNGKPLQNNTRLFYYEHEDCYVVRLHATDVVTIYPDGQYKLDTGGWRTMTTKDRLTAYSPAVIRSRKGVWDVESDVDWTPYFDGIIVDLDGNCLNN